MERRGQGVLRLSTRSPNRFVVVRAESRRTIPLIAIVIVMALFLVELPMSVRGVIVIGVAAMLLLHMRSARADLWLERPPGESEAPVPARLETTGISAENVFIRISEVSGKTMRSVETFEVLLEKHGNTSVARFAIPPIAASKANVIVTAVMARRVYRFKVR
jgi:hypothetical protein